MYDLNRYREHVENQKKKATAEHLKATNQLVQAAVSAEQLTGNPHWDVYLSYLQASLEQILETVEMLKHRLLSPEIYGYEELAMLKASILRYQERAWTLRVVMNLPKEIIETGKIVNDELKITIK